MATRRVLVVVRTTPRPVESGMMVLEAKEVAPQVPGLKLDTSFGAVPLPVARPAPQYESAATMAEELNQPVIAGYVIRGEMDEKQAEKAAAQKDVIGVYADVAIAPFLICPGSPALGDDSVVERLLCTSRLHSLGADGRGVLVAIVDTGVNIAYLNSKGKHPHFDAARSWTPIAGQVPGSLPVNHGTMCAFDVCIAAPNCTILDIALLQSTTPGGTVMEGLLSDAVRAYQHLIDVMSGPRQPGESRSLVVSNSWGMFHPSWDFPVGHPSNYSDNPNHPFNLIVGTLESMGADILFAAGNCGAPCPDGRCQGVTGSIYGANSHAQVLSVAGVDTSKQRVGYSNQGPGRLTHDKPDLCGYTHFRGSGVYSADGGTSAACPVVAGLVAAYRSKRPYAPGNPSVSPSAVRNLFRSTCEDLGASGYDLDYGFGVVRGCTIAERLEGAKPIDICRRFPWLCRPIPLPIELCKRFPQLCQPRIPVPKPKPGPLPFSQDVGDAYGVGTAGADYGMLDLGPNGEGLEALGREDLIELIYTLGYLDGSSGSEAPLPAGAGEKPPHKCSCS